MKRRTFIGSALAGIAALSSPGRGTKLPVGEIPTRVFGHAAAIESSAQICPWVRLDPDGRLAIRAGYSWDGASGPAIDTPNIMVASLAHDALYQLISEGHLPKRCRRAADLTLRKLCERAGMGAFRRWYVWLAVRLFGWLHV